MPLQPNEVGQKLCDPPDTADAKPAFNVTPWREAIKKIAAENRLVVIMEAHNISEHRAWIEQTLPFLAVAIESPVFALVLVLGCHFGDWFQTDRFLACLDRSGGRGVFAQANGLDDRTAVHALDGQGHFSALLQLLGPQPFLEVLPFLVQDFGILGDLDGPVLAIGEDVEHTVVGIYLLDGADHLKGLHRTAQNQQPKGCAE